MTHTYNSDMREAEAGESPQVWGHLGLHNNYQTNQGYVVNSMETKNNFVSCHTQISPKVSFIVNSMYL